MIGRESLYAFCLQALEQYLWRGLKERAHIGHQVLTMLNPLLLDIS